jgi:hypothetical protein
MNGEDQKEHRAKIHIYGKDQKQHRAKMHMYGKEQFL